MNHGYPELVGLYTDVFHARTGSIPLLVNPPLPESPTVDELWNNLPGAVQKCGQALRPKVEIGSDWIPSLSIGLYQCICVPSLFGAKVIKLDGSEPICSQCIDDIGSVLKKSPPAVKGPVIDRMLGDVRKAQDILEKFGFMLSFPVTSSPFDLAQLMVGEEFFIEMVHNPAGAKEFLFYLADLCIDAARLVKREMSQGDKDYLTNRGMYFPGYRLPCDSIVNYSPQMLREFVLPVLDRFCDAFGPLCIHFCTEPSPSGHILPVLLESESVLAVDNWQGPDVFIRKDAPAALQDKIAVVGSLDLSDAEKMDTFLKSDPVRMVPRENGRGLVMATAVADVEEGKRVYEMWQNRMENINCLNRV